MPPQGGPPLHRHLAQDEWWHILEGRFLFEVDGKQIPAVSGDTVYAPRGTAHTFLNVGGTAGRTLVSAIPGNLDIFFQELSEMVPRGATPDPAMLAPLFAKYGLELLGPPMSAREER